MNLNFGQVFQCTLVNDIVNPYVIPLSKTPMRILLVSDTHLGATVDPNRAISMLYNELSELVKTEKVTMICHLGDLVDGTMIEGTKVLSNVLTKMTELKVPFYVIGGNHDRDFFTTLQWKKNQYVTPLKENAILFELPKTNPKEEPQKIYLAHDLLNNYRVRDQFAFSFIAWIKDGCKKYIKPTDWLITGHTHTSLISYPTRIACVGQFSPEINVFGYAILEFVDGKVSIATKLIPNKMAK